MARNEDRTEKPTPKRKREARRKGQVARSPDVSGWVVMLAGSALVPWLFRNADRSLNSLLGAALVVTAKPSPAGAVRVMESGLGAALNLVLPVVGAFAAIAVFANVAQTGLALSLAAAKPKWDHLNPVSGIKRLFSPQSAWMLLKQTLKLAVPVGVAYASLKGLGRTLVGSQPVGMAPVLTYTGSNILGLVRDVAAIGLLLAAGDYAYQRHQLQKSMKMTKQEVKDENRQTDGDPLVKREIRRKMYRMSRARMMAAVAGADVVVVNPTHYAVALRYEPGLGRAPRVVAKGTDELALRIREEGCKHKVPVVEDPPVARALYGACDIDECIPGDLYVVVARLLAFVFTLPAVVRQAGLVHRRPVSAMLA